MQPMLLAFLLSIAAADAPGGEVCDYSQIAKLTATDATVKDSFGISVAIDGDFVVAGMIQNDANGSAYVFHTTDGGLTYPQVARLMPSDSEGGDNFGGAVAIDGDTIVVSAGYKDGGEDCYQQSTPYGYQEIGADCNTAQSTSSARPTAGARTQRPS